MHKRFDEPKINVYTCSLCKAKIVTEDIDEGVTPMMLLCRATPGCRGTMTSSFYHSSVQSQTPTHEWYKPNTLDGLSPPVRAHVEEGGLMLREKQKP